MSDKIMIIVGLLALYSSIVSILIAALAFTGYKVLKRLLTNIEIVERIENRSGDLFVSLEAFQEHIVALQNNDVFLHEPLIIELKRHADKVSRDIDDFRSGLLEDANGTED